MLEKMNKGKTRKHPAWRPLYMMVGKYWKGNLNCWMSREVPTHYFHFQLFDEKLEMKKMESLWMEMAPFQHEQTKNYINPVEAKQSSYKGM